MTLQGVNYISTDTKVSVSNETPAKRSRDIETHMCWVMWKHPSLNRSPTRPFLSMTAVFKTG